MISRRRLADLTTAAEHYERLVRDGMAKGQALRSAMMGLRKTMRPDIAPQELPTVIARIVRSQVKPERFHGVMRDLEIGFIWSGYGSLRSLLYYVLTRYGYHPKQIGDALKRDRSTVLASVRAYEKRLAKNDLLRARVEAIVTSGAERQVA